MAKHQQFNKIVVLLFGSLVLMFLSACNSAPSPDMQDIPDGGNGQSSPPALDPNLVTQGEVLYAQYCATCHGSNLEGQPNWKTSFEDGSFPAPPHDSSGHTWHHADDLLIDIIANGSDFEQTKMPVFGEQLTGEEIIAILEYLKSSWGPEERAFQWQVTQQSQ